MVNAIVCLAKFHQIFAKIHSLILPIFFLWNFFPLKYAKKSWEAGRDVFRTQSNSLDWVFCGNNSRWLWAINYFCKKLHLRCLTGFWIRLWNLSWTRRFAISLMKKSFNWLNCLNDLSGMQVRNFLLKTFFNILIM